MFFFLEKYFFSQQRSSAAMARDIVRTNGIGTTGLYRGLGATLWRHGVWNMFYFGIYHNLRTYCAVVVQPKQEHQAVQG